MTATTVIFDLDGTLVDSSPDIAAALNRAFAELNVRELGDAEVLRMLGGGPRILVGKALTAVDGPTDDAAIDAALERYTSEYLSDPSSRTEFFADAAEALPALAARGLRLGICTNKRTDLSERLLEHLGVRGLFGSLVGSDIATAPKPEAAHLNDVIAELGVSAEDCLYVGDTGIDQRTAEAAGVPYVHVTWGHEVDGADVVIERFAELQTLVDAYPA